MTSREVPSIVLASASPTRAAILRNAGLTFDVAAAGIDETAIKQSLLGDGANGAAIADALAELKAVRVSQRRPGAFVIGADQVLVCDGALFDKPADLGAARSALLALRGRSHELVSAAVVARDGAPIWRHGDTAYLQMRPFSETFLDHYLADMGQSAVASVGAYQVEGLGIQLFSRITGDHFTILGLPLLPLLDFLRSHDLVTR